MDKTWFSRRPVQVFIDNSALRSIHFNLEHPSLATIKEAINAGDLELIVTDISKGEFLKHANGLLQEDRDRVRKIVASRSFFQTEIDHLIESVETLDGQKLWDKYATEFSPRSINCPVDWQSVFSDYFALKPPFSSGKKKEFPDAFTIKMIEAAKPNRLVVVSGDGDFSTWALGRTNTTHFSGLAEFTDKYLKVRKERLAAISQQALNAVQLKVIEQLKNRYSDDWHYEVNCGHSEIEGAEVVRLDLIEAELTEIEESEGQAKYSVRFHGEASLDLNCPVVVWDSIDKEEITLGSNSRQAKVELEIRATLNIMLDQDNPERSEFELEDDEMSADSFDVPDDWTSFLDPDPEDYER